MKKYMIDIMNKRVSSYKEACEIQDKLKSLGIRAYIQEREYEGKDYEP